MRGTGTSVARPLCDGKSGNSTLWKARAPEDRTGEAAGEEQMAKGQKRSTREKKKPKANKKVVVPASSGFSSSLGQHKPPQGLGKK